MVSNYTETYNGSLITISVESNTGQGTHTITFTINAVDQWIDDTANNLNIGSRISIGLKSLRDTIDNIEDPELAATLDAFGFTIVT